MMPEYGLGLWQCKLRYQTQDELLTVAREYKRRGLPLDVIVADFFHWPMQGEYQIRSRLLARPCRYDRGTRSVGNQTHGVGLADHRPQLLPIR